MIYVSELDRGVKKKHLPSPRIVDFMRSSNYEDVIKLGKELFFKEETDDLELYCLCGTSGIPFHIEDKDNWNIYDFMKDHGYQPSKFKLYVMLKSTEVSYIQEWLYYDFIFLKQHTKYTVTDSPVSAQDQDKTEPISKNIM